MNGQTPKERAAWCKAMREFVDLVESDPVIPVPDNVDVWTHLWPGESGMTQAQWIAAVHDFAERFGAPVTATGPEHRQTHIKIGEIEMWVHAYPEHNPHAPRSAEKWVVSRADDATLMADEPSEAELGVRKAMDRMAGRRRATHAYSYGEHREIAGCVRQAGHDDPARPGYEGYRSAHFNSICGEWHDPAGDQVAKDLAECIDEAQAELADRRAADLAFPVAGSRCGGTARNGGVCVLNHGHEGRHVGWKMLVDAPDGGLVPPPQCPATYLSGCRCELDEGHGGPLHIDGGISWNFAAPSEQAAQRLAAAGGECLDESIVAAGEQPRCPSVAVDDEGVSFRCVRDAGHEDPSRPGHDPDLARHYHAEFTGWIEDAKGLAVLG